MYGKYRSVQAGQILPHSWQVINRLRHYSLQDLLESIALMPSIPSEAPRRLQSCLGLFWGHRLRSYA